jgi:hypothetical protein
MMETGKRGEQLTRGELVQCWLGYVFSEGLIVSGRQNVVCFKDLVSHIVSDKWYQQQLEDNGNATEKIVQSAARLIWVQMHEVDYDLSHCPYVDKVF